MPLLDKLIVLAKFRDEQPDNTSRSYTSDPFDPELPGSLSHFYETISS